MSGAPHAFAVGVVSDEVSRGVDGLAAFAREHRLDHVELNFVDGASICDLAPDARERVRARMEAMGVTVSLIGARSFRGHVDDQAAFAADLRHLRRAAETARMFGVEGVRVFSFRRVPHDEPALRARVRGRLAEAATLADGEGIVLHLENTGSGTVATTEEAREHFASTDGAMRLLWDPGNAAGAGDRTPAHEAFRHLRPWIEQVHVKNAAFAGGERVWTTLGTGLVDWPALLHRLASDPRPLRLTLDTHFRRAGDETGAASTLLCLRELRAMLSDR